MLDSSEVRGPCDWCRAKHVKCDGLDSCERCTKSGRSCTRLRRKEFKFKEQKHERSRLTFSANQQWVSPSKDVSYVDVSTKYPNVVQSDGGELTHTEELSTVGLEIAQPAGYADPSMSTTNDTLPTDDSEYLSLHQLNSSQSMQHISQDHVQVENDLAGPVDTAHQYAQEQSFTPATLSLTSPSVNSGTPFSVPSYTNPVKTTSIRGLPETVTDEAYLDVQEAVLLRHFTMTLARSMDTTDRDRHFEVVVPNRAMFCPVLRYAILTTSARHFTRLYRRNSDGIFTLDGKSLPDLDEDSAIRYHNICINLLIEISNDPAQHYNEDALTAATILRVHEQIDTPLSGKDNETYLQVVNTIINSHQKESFYSLESIVGPPRDNDYYLCPATSMRHSACLIALQQEIWAVLWQRRPVRLPLCPHNQYSQFEAADDFVWANRILVYTGDVVKFCFGSDRSKAIIKKKSRQEQYAGLIQFEQTWVASRPPSFKAAFYRPANPDEGQYFPEIWQVTDCQALALQHVELSRVLLAVFDPSVQRLGPGVISRQRFLGELIHKALLYICGLACSNLTCLRTLVTAAVSCRLLGEHITKPGEQNAVVSLLQDLEKIYAWPTTDLVQELQQTWREGI